MTVMQIIQMYKKNKFISLGINFVLFCISIIFAILIAVVISFFIQIIFNIDSTYHVCPVVAYCIPTQGQIIMFLVRIASLVVSFIGVLICYFRQVKEINNAKNK